MLQRDLPWSLRQRCVPFFGKVGATVSKLKKHADEGLSSDAKALVKKWKKVAEASGVQATPGKAEKSVQGKSMDNALELDRALVRRPELLICNWDTVPIPGTLPFRVITIFRVCRRGTYNH